MSWARGRSQSRSDFEARSGWWPRGAHAGNWTSPKSGRKQRQPSSERYLPRRQSRGGGSYDTWRDSGADGRGGFGQAKSPRTPPNTFDQRWRPGWRDFGSHARSEPDELYNACVKASKLTAHRAGVRDAAVARLADLTAKAARAALERDAEQANLDARELAFAAAEDDERKWSDKFNARRAEQEESANANDNYAMWVDEDGPAATQQVSAATWDRLKDSEDPGIQEILCLIKAAQPRLAWASTQPFRAGAAGAPTPTPTQPDCTADCDGMKAYGEALAIAHLIEDSEASLIALQAAHAKFRTQAPPTAGKGSGKAAATPSQADSPYAGKSS
jgi:hypothetical protein